MLIALCVMCTALLILLIIALVKLDAVASHAERMFDMLEADIVKLGEQNGVYAQGVRNRLDAITQKIQK